MKVTPSFCFAFKILDDPTASSIYIVYLNKILILGVLIGAQGKNVKTLRAATKCEISLVTSNYEGRAIKTKKYDTEPQVSTYFCSD